jgi:molybdopterin converting factor small subunit
MATVHIPAHWRDLADGRETVEVSGSTLGRVLDSLAKEAPALAAVLFEEGTLRGEIAVAIDSEVTENDPLEPVREGAEIFLIPAIAGG